MVGLSSKVVAYFTSLIYRNTLGGIIGKPEYISKIHANEIPNMLRLFHKEDTREYTRVNIIDHSPDVYYEQNIPLCGGFSIAAILEAFSIHQDGSICDLMSESGKLVGGMLPKDLTACLKRYGVDSRIRKASKLQDYEKIRTLRMEIDKGFPVIILIGNGHEKSGQFNEGRSNRLSHLHWITIWGYHDDGFFIYDSSAHPYQYEFIPIGNRERSNESLLHDWSRPMFLSPILGNLLITIDPLDMSKALHT